MSKRRISAIGLAAVPLLSIGIALTGPASAQAAPPQLAQSMPQHAWPHGSFELKNTTNTTWILDYTHKYQMHMDLPAQLAPGQEVEVDYSAALKSAGADWIDNDDEVGFQYVTADHSAAGKQNTSVYNFQVTGHGQVTPNSWITTNYMMFTEYKPVNNKTYGVELQEETTAPVPMRIIDVGNLPIPTDAMTL